MQCDSKHCMCIGTTVVDIEDDACHAKCQSRRMRFSLCSLMVKAFHPRDFCVVNIDFFVFHLYICPPANGVWGTALFTLCSEIEMHIAIWRHSSGSTMAQVMACCLTAPCYYLNQCWLPNSELPWQSRESNFTAPARDSILHKFGNYTFTITTTSPRGQWVNMRHLG